MPGMCCLFFHHVRVRVALMPILVSGTSRRTQGASLCLLSETHLSLGTTVLLQLRLKNATGLGNLRYVRQGCF